MEERLSSWNCYWIIALETTYRNLREFWDRVSFQIGNRSQMFISPSRPKLWQAKLNQQMLRSKNFFQKKNCGLESKPKQATAFRMEARNHIAAAGSANRKKIQRRLSLWCSRDLIIERWQLEGSKLKVLSSHVLVFLCDFWKSLLKSQSACLTGGNTCLVLRIFWGTHGCVTDGPYYSFAKWT